MHTGLLKAFAVIVLVSSVLNLTNGEPAFSVPSATNASGKCGRGGCDADASSGSQSGNAQPVSKSSLPPCRWIPADSLTSGQVVYDNSGNPIQVDGTGHWYEVQCPSTDGQPNFERNQITAHIGGVPFYLVYVRPVDAKALQQQALAHLTFTVPTLHFSPANMSIVNSPTFLWIDGWGQQAANATAGAVSVDVVAKPARVIWSMGDGGSVTCNGPGVAIDVNSAADQTSDCSYTYRRSSAGQPGNAFSVTATVEWSTSWAATGIPGGGDLGTYTSSNTVQAQVGEIQAVNVYPGAAS